MPNQPYFRLSLSEDRSKPESEELTCQPFLNEGAHEGMACVAMRMARDFGEWKQGFSVEQTAYALSQVTAANILPPLMPLPCGTDLLEYQVWLRDHMDHGLVDELAMVLHTSARALNWEQVGSTMYLCVIGAGVAACLDMTSGAEQLYLRYASDLEHALYLAGRTIDLPRSRLFLQTTLYEKMDALLAHVRERTWHWISD